MNRNEWLQRYRRRYRQRRADLSAEQLDGVADIEAFDSLSGDHPDDPEAAAENTTLDWDQELRPH